MSILLTHVLKLLGDGYTAQDIVRAYPELELEDVYEAARYGVSGPPSLNGKQEFFRIGFTRAICSSSRPAG